MRKCASVAPFLFHGDFMAEYDGSIRINTQIDTKNASSQMMGLVNQIQKIADKVNSLRAKMDALGDTQIPTKQYKEIETDIAKAEKELQKLIEKQAQMQTEGKDSGSAWERLNQRIQAAKDYIAYAREEMQQLVDSGKAFTLGRDTQEYANLGQQLSYAESDLARLNRRYDELNAKQGDIPGQFSRMRASAQKAFNAMRSGLSTVGRVGKKAFSGIFNMAKKLFYSITSGSKQSNASLSGGLKTILRYGFGIRSVYALFNKIRSGMTEGFKNLMGYSDEFANSIQSVKNSMSTLGNQIAAAFAPIVQMVIPWLNSLISTLSTAMTYVAQFIAALTGKSTFTKATQIQDKYNKSLGGTAKAADKARGALAKFDDLDVLEKKQEDASGGGVDVTDPADMFKQEKIGDKWKNIADWFREMWENSDFYELGKLLGEKLKEALESIPWDEIKETARKIGTSLATLINGFIEVEGLGFTIGNTLAQAFNTGFEFLNAFIHSLHWDSIGEFIADTINGFFSGIDWNLVYDTFVTGAKGLGDAINAFVDELDWDLIAETISNFFNTLIDTIYTFITTVDWAEIGEKVGKTISDAWTGIDWAKAGETVGESFKAFFDFISNAIENIDWYAIGESVREFLCGIDWAGVADSFFEFVGAAFAGFASFLIGLFGDSFITGSAMSEEALQESAGNLWEGFCEGIKNAFVSIGEFVKNSIFDPFMEGIRNAFGIHSPATSMMEIGGYLIEGLKNGLLTWESIKDTIGTIASGVIEKFKSVLGISGASPSSEMEENGSHMVEGLHNGIESTIDSVYALFNPDTWTEIGTQMFNALMLTVEVFREMWTEAFTLWQEENTELYFGYDIWYEQWQNMLLAYNDVNSEFISEWQSNIDSWWQTMVMPYFTVLQWKTFGENMRNGIMQGFKAIVNNIAGVLNQVIQIFNSAYKQLQDAMNDLIDDYNAKAAIMGTSTLSHVSYKAMQSIKVPALASGAVIRGGNPFMAILGDQPVGQTNIEAPLSTIEQAVENVMNRNGYNNNPYNGVSPVIALNVNGETFARLTLGDILSEMNRQGYNVDVLGEA